jgi:hypothetical protein
MSNQNDIEVLAELAKTIEEQRETIEFLLSVIKDMMGEDNA